MATPKPQSQGAEADARVATFHARLRWIGAPLLFSGALLLFWAVTAALRGGSGWLIMLGMLGTGMGLASFGANHDTAMASALRAQEGGSGAALPEELAREVAEELQKDRAELLSLRPSPRIAAVLPLVALAAQGYLLWRLSAGLLDLTQ